MSLKILLTSLSPSPRDTVYYLEQDQTKQVQAEQSPLALLQLLPQEKLPRKIVVLCTDKIKKTTYSALEKVVTTSYPDVTVLPVDIPNGESKHELWEIMHTILGDQDLIPVGCRLTLDLTHGFRSFPFIFFTAALYLQALRQVQIEAAYYGIIEVGSRENLQPKPIVDVSLILEMVEWFYATRVFTETGQAKDLIAMLDPFISPPAGLKGPECKPYGQVKALQRDFQNVADAYAQALPVEFGMQAEKLFNKLDNPIPEHLLAQMPLPEELFGTIKQFITPFVLRGLDDKKKLALDEGELQRQASIIDRYLEQGYISNAAGMIREWMVSVSLYHAHVGVGEQVAGTKWLDYKESRKDVENKLGYMASIYSDKKTKHVLYQRHWWLAEQWGTITDLRNSLLHYGMRLENSLLSPGRLKKISRRWQEIKGALGDVSKWRLDDVLETGSRGIKCASRTRQAGQKKTLPTGNTLLITPLGLSKGLLYSALHCIGPDAVLVISSAAAAQNLDEIKQQVGWTGETHVARMQDPHAGFAEVAEINAKAQPLLDRFHRVVVNITGGTTAMQHIVQQIYEQAASKNNAVEQVALVDRRSPHEQREHPYQVGELIRLL